MATDALVKGAPIVTLSGVGKVFGSGTEALSAIDLTVNAGAFVTLLGPSGCGKSTILRLMAGLDEPTTGSIAWHGGRRPEVGFVFQEPTLMPWAAVFENVWLPLRLKGVSRRAATGTVMSALEAVGLADFAGALPRELSGGMKMRASIARALAINPRVLFMDEPFAALDEITRFRLNDDLLRLWDENGWTILFVTHSVFEAVYLSERIAVMGPRPGRIMNDVAIDEPYPRDASFRTSQRYAETAATVSAALSRAMGEGP